LIPKQVYATARFRPKPVFTTPQRNEEAPPPEEGEMSEWK
jgi:hypothetical protein